jgi:hypothetical protein
VLLAKSKHQLIAVQSDCKSKDWLTVVASKRIVFIEEEKTVIGCLTDRGGLSKRVFK